MENLNRQETYPHHTLTFHEFLRAADPKLYEYADGIDEIKHLPEIILNKLKVEYKRFMICGGMPEAASTLLDGGRMTTKTPIHSTATILKEF